MNDRDLETNASFLLTDSLPYSIVEVALEDVMRSVERGRKGIQDDEITPILTQLFFNNYEQ